MYNIEKQPILRPGTAEDLLDSSSPNLVLGITQLSQKGNLMTIPRHDFTMEGDLDKVKEKLPVLLKGIFGDSLKMPIPVDKRHGLFNFFSENAVGEIAAMPLVKDINGRQKIEVTIKECYVLETEADAIYLALTECTHDYVAPKAMDRDGRQSRHIDITMLSQQGDDVIPSSAQMCTDEAVDVYAGMYPYLNVDCLVRQYAESSSSVLIFSGKPGNGKTSLMRKVVAELAHLKERALRVVTIKDEKLLENDAIYNAIDKGQVDVVMLDDIDTVLAPRALTKGGNAAMTKLLYFANGAVKNSVKIIITTNRDLTKKENVDDALIRKGRCLDVLELPELSYGEAHMIWAEYYKNPSSSFVELFGEENELTISQAELATEAELYTKDGSVTYINRPEISVRGILGGDRVVRAKRSEYEAPAIGETESTNHSMPTFGSSVRIMHGNIKH